MTNKNNKRYENRETTLKGIAVNLETFEQQEFELTTAYVRSTDKAMAIALDMLKLDDAWIINPKKFEVLNEKPKPIEYNESKIYDYASYTFTDETQANEEYETSYKGNGYSLIAIRWFEYEGQFWAYETYDEKYVTDFVHDESPMNLTKADARAFIAQSAVELIGSNYKVLGVHNCTKHEIKAYCIIDDEELEKCIVK